MRSIKAILYGIGAAGRTIPRCMVKKGIDIVGAIDINPEIVGKDLGEVAGLGYPLNVKISDDADAVLSKHEADIAVVCTFTLLEMAYPQFQKCIENGLNVITLAEEAYYPWISAPELASKLDRLAKKHGVTIAGSGSQDAIMVGLLTVLTGGCNHIESITGKLHASPDEFGPVVLAKYLVGVTKEEFHRKIEQEGIWQSNLIWQVEAVIADLGLTVKKIEKRAEPVIAEADIWSKSLGKTLKKGWVIGTTIISGIETEQGIKFQMEEIGKVREKGDPEAFTNEWLIKGEPDLHLRVKRDPLAIASALVNRIPDVINSEPGLVTLQELPKLKYRAYPLHYYLR